jgi:hypothetical protein
MSTSYHPELDITPELDTYRANYFQSQIGVLQWAVKLRCIDIVTEVSILSSHLALPREGHLEAIWHAFAYLENRHNSWMVFDPMYAVIDLTHLKEVDWKPFYGNVQEALPNNAPPPRGKDVDLCLYVDADHTGDKLTC